MGVVKLVTTSPDLRDESGGAGHNRMASARKKAQLEVFFRSKNELSGGTKTKKKYRSSRRRAINTVPCGQGTICQRRRAGTEGWAEKK